MTNGRKCGEFCGKERVLLKVRCWAAGRRERGIGEAQGVVKGAREGGQAVVVAVV